MRSTVSAFVFLALLLFGVPAGAQEPEAQEAETQPWDWDEETSSYFLLEEVLMRGSDDPTLESPLAAPQPRLILETKDGNTVLKARIGMEMQKRFMLDLQVASPTNQSGDKVTTLASLDGLSNGGSAEIGFSWVLWPEKMKEMAKTMLDEARQEIPELGQQPETAGTQRGMAMKLYNNPETSFAARPSAVAALGPTLYDQTVERAREQMEDYTPKFLTARATVGRQEFHFVDETTLKADDQTHAEPKLTASFGAYMMGKFYVAASYSGGRKFVAKGTANLCSPFEETDSFECRDVVLGAPEERTTENFEVEIRRLFGTLGFQAKLNRDLRENITFVEVPVYFLRSLGLSNMNLDGGVAVRWNSETDDFSIRAFIGPSLSTVFRMNG